MGIYYETYPNVSEWYASFVAFNESRDGKLPLADLTNSDIKLLNTIASVLLMFAMGLATDVNVFLKVIKNIPLCLTGALTQFIIMPLIGIAFLQIFQFHQLEALAIFLFMSSPGGGNSNLMAFYMNLNLELSLTLTTLTTILALGEDCKTSFTLLKYQIAIHLKGFMPAFMELLPFLVDIGDNEDLLKIPFDAIGENLGILCGALIGAMIISYWRQELAAKASKIITPIVYPYVICCSVISLLKFFPFGVMTKNILIFAFLNGPIGGLFSYLVSYPLGLASNKLQASKSKLAKCCGSDEKVTWRDFHTIAIETGNQNAVVSQLIMLSAYTSETPSLMETYYLGFIVPFPIFMVLIGQAETIFILLTFFVGKFFKNRGKIESSEKLKKFEDLESQKKMEEKGQDNLAFENDETHF